MSALAKSKGEERENANEVKGGGSGKEKKKEKKEKKTNETKAAIRGCNGHTPRKEHCVGHGLAVQLGMICCYSFVRSTGAFTYKGLRQCCTINRQRRNLAHGVARSVIVSRLFVLHQVDWDSLVLDRLPRQCWEERGKRKGVLQK